MLQNKKITELPCIDCITLPICLQIYKDNINKKVLEGLESFDWAVCMLMKDCELLTLFIKKSPKFDLKKAVIVANYFEGVKANAV